MCNFFSRFSPQPTSIHFISCICFPYADKALRLAMAMRTAGGNAAFHNFHNDFAHIVDPNERRRLALAEIDKAPFGWYHIRAIIVAGIGFFTDAYDLFAISLVTNLLGIVYWHNAKSKPGSIPSNSDTAIKISTSAGKASFSL